MAEEPLVTVVVPTYRRGRWLAEALASAVGQTHRHVEVIVSDDGSAEPYAERIVAAVADPRVRVRRNAANLGQAGNNRAAFAEARGKYVANLHDDDVWELSFLTRLVEPLERDPSLVLAFSDHWLVADDGAIRPAETDANSLRWGRSELRPGRHQPFIDLAAVRQTVPMAMATLWRRAAVPFDQMPPEVNSAYDVFLAYLAARDGGAAWYVPERLTRYRVHGQSATGTRSLTWTESGVTAHQIMYDDDRLSAVRRDVGRKLGGWSTSLAIDLVGLGRCGAARRHAWAGFRLDPGPRSAVAVAVSLLPPAVGRRAVARMRAAPAAGES